MEKELLRINVRSLAEYYFEGGDLVSTRGLMQRMLEGTRGHQQLQSAYEAGWRSEVPVKMEIERRGIPILLHGRIDGLKIDENEVAIEEIKTTFEDTNAMTGEEHPVHWAQAELYAVMMAENENRETVSVKLTYLNLNGGKASFSRSYTRDQLMERLETYLVPMLDWIETQAVWLLKSRASMSTLAFPFDEYRAGQREMAANVYVALRDGKNLLCQAATGIGKTMASLFPAIMALREGRIGRIFYLTARSTGRLSAEQALNKLRNKGLSARSVSITAKDTICPMAERDCRPEVCSRAQGYYDRRRAALYEATRLERLDRAGIEALAEKHMLCPFELSLDLAEIADVVICDYNYVFDPRVKLQRFFTGKSDAGLLIDEAHNLCPRTRDMLSAQIAQNDLIELRRMIGKEVSRKHPAYKALTVLMAELKAIREEIDAPEAREDMPNSLLDAAKTFVEQGESWLGEGWSCSKQYADVFFDILGFVRTSADYDDHYRTLIEPNGKSAVTVRLWCADPSAYLAGTLKKIHGAALFSATLSPLDFYRDVMGLTEETSALLDLPSPFPQDHLRVLHYALPLRYKEREASLDRLCEAIKCFISAKTGNYLICFPSYAFMRQAIERTDWPARLLIQAPNMDEEARRAFLNEIEAKPTESTAVFVVMGGAFSEGVDLPDNRLCGAVIVGTGVPQLNFEGDTLRALYEDRYQRGYAYAYQYPGLARVYQAAGRIIRSETDRGSVLLIDDRWGRADHRNILPPHWQVKKVGSGNDITKELKEFWTKEREQ